jgi:hypothetical protein
MRMFICDERVFFEKFIEFKTIFNIKMKTPGPSHQFDDKSSGIALLKEFKAG